MKGHRARLGAMLPVIALATACARDPAAGCGTPSLPPICAGPRTAIAIDSTPDTGSYVNVSDGDTYIGQAIPSGTIEVARECTAEGCDFAVCSWDLALEPTDLIAAIIIEGGAATHTSATAGASFPPHGLRLLISDGSGAGASYCNDAPFVISEDSPGTWQIWASMVGTGNRRFSLTLFGSS